MSLSKPLIICITGPESSGKSTLAQFFTSNKNVVVIPEYAREYISNLTRNYVQSDLEIIAKEQLNLIKNADSELIISDTGVEVIKIWNDEKFNQSHRIEKLLKAQHQVVDAYWLCKPDIPWASDPLRENQNDRMRLFKLYQSLLDELKVPFIILEGSHDKRILAALEYLEHKKTLN